MHRDQCGEYCICILLPGCEGLTQGQKHQNGEKKASLTATFRRAPSSKCQSSITDLQSCMIFKQGWMFLSTEATSAGVPVYNLVFHAKYQS